MLRFFGMCLCIVLGFAAASRLQVHEGARFVTRSGEVIDGTVSRDFMTGDYVIQIGSAERHIESAQFGSMAMSERRLSIGSIVAAIAGLVMGLMIGFCGGLPNKGKFRFWSAG